MKKSIEKIFDEYLFQEYVDTGWISTGHFIPIKKYNVFKKQILSLIQDREKQAIINYRINFESGVDICTKEMLKAIKTGKAETKSFYSAEEVQDREKKIRKESAKVVEEMMEDSEHWKPIADRIMAGGKSDEKKVPCRVNETSDAPYYQVNKEDDSLPRNSEPTKKKFEAFYQTNHNNPSFLPMWNYFQDMLEPLIQDREKKDE